MWSMKRGRGRPRKDSLYSNFSNTQNSYLEDLQFSTDDEEFEEVVADFDTTAAVLGQGEALARSAQPINYLPGGHGEDESQQAAEAMVQLSSSGFYNQQDESLDVDPNYDPSDFLKLPGSRQDNHDMGMIKQELHQEMQQYDMHQEELQQHEYEHQEYQQQDYQQMDSVNIEDMYQQHQPQQQQQLQYQLQQEYQHQNDMMQHQQRQDLMQMTENMLTFHNNDGNNQHHPQEDIGVGIDDDLAISDSDEGEDNYEMPMITKEEVVMENDNENEDDGDGLWF